MALISLRQMLDHAAERGYGVPAFNVNNLEQMRAIMEAADKTDSPVIVQASAGARKYAGAPFLRHLILAAIEEFPHIPVAMHQDHGTSPAVCQRSIQLGFSSVMMDGSLGEDGKTPTDYEYNVDVTRRTVEMAHACGVSVEGELGCLGSLETGQAGEEDGIGAEGTLDHSQMLTDPEEAADFVKKTHVDALAIAIGTSTAPTNSPVRRLVTSWLSTRSRPSTPVSRTPTWLCTAPAPYPRSGCRSSTNTVVRFRKPTVFRLRKSWKASSTACVRSTSTPTCVWPALALPVASWPRTRPSSIRANS